MESTRTATLAKNLAPEVVALGVAAALRKPHLYRRLAVTRLRHAATQGSVVQRVKSTSRYFSTHAGADAHAACSGRGCRSGTHFTVKQGVKDSVQRQSERIANVVATSSLVGTAVAARTVIQESEQKEQREALERVETALEEQGEVIERLAKQADESEKESGLLGFLRRYV